MSSAVIKVGRQVKELRLHMCNVSPSSKGLRDFVENHYVSLKKNNSTLPILVRECEGGTPKIWVRVDKGGESCMEVDNLSAKDILSKIQALQRDWYWNEEKKKNDFVQKRMFVQENVCRSKLFRFGRTRKHLVLDRDEGRFFEKCSVFVIDHMSISSWNCHDFITYLRDVPY